MKHPPPLPPYEQVKAKLGSYKDPDALVNLQRLEYAYYRSVYDEYEAGCTQGERDFVFGQAVTSIGDVAFVPYPFEIFAETSMRLRAYSPFRYTLCLSNSNGYNAYLPTEDQIVRGGYEIGCFLYSSAHPLVNNADQVILDETLRIMKR